MIKYSLSIPQQSSFPQGTTFSSGFAKSDIHTIVDHIASQWFIKKSCSRSVFSELTIAEFHVRDLFSFSIILLSVTAIVALSALWKVNIHFSKIILMKVIENKERAKQRTNQGRASVLGLKKLAHPGLASLARHCCTCSGQLRSPSSSPSPSPLSWSPSSLSSPPSSLHSLVSVAETDICKGRLVLGNVDEGDVGAFVLDSPLSEGEDVVKEEFGAFVGRWCWWLCWMLVHLFSAPWLIERMLLRNMKP